MYFVLIKYKVEIFTSVSVTAFNVNITTFTHFELKYNKTIKKTNNPGLLNKTDLVLKLKAIYFI